MQYKLNSQIGGPTWGNYSLPEYKIKLSSCIPKKLDGLKIIFSSDL